MTVYSSVLTLTTFCHH